MQGRAAYIRPKVVGPFPGPCVSGSYVHRAAIFSLRKTNAKNLNFEGSMSFFFTFCSTVLLCFNREILYAMAFWINFRLTDQ
jgi:hypothetical protein